jgi:hypothetical protein
VGKSLFSSCPNDSQPPHPLPRQNNQVALRKANNHPPQEASNQTYPKALHPQSEPQRPVGPNNSSIRITSIATGSDTNHYRGPRISESVWVFSTPKSRVSRGTIDKTQGRQTKPGSPGRGAMSGLEGQPRCVTETPILAAVTIPTPTSRLMASPGVAGEKS